MNVAAVGRKLAGFVRRRRLGATYLRRRWKDRSRRLRWSKFRLPLQWEATPYNRVALLNEIAGLIGASSYLEIGCADDKSFHGVACAHKVGVDPARGGTHRMTSDEFFTGSNERFDLVFVDGLHEHRQALADVENALGALERRGVVVMHDCLPTSYAEQAMPRQRDAWTGDVWKAMFELKARPELDVRVCAIDHGCGVVLPRSRTDTFELDVDAVPGAGFEFFVEHWPKLGVLDYETLVSWVGDYAASARPEAT